MYMVKYTVTDENLYYKDNSEAFKAIKASDGVHIIGVSGNQLMYIHKYNGSEVYNLPDRIKLNRPSAHEYKMEVNDSYYFIMILVDNDDGRGVVETPDTGESSSNAGAASFTWVFYVLGVIGVLGGGFLMMKLRKKVRAA